MRRSTHFSTLRTNNGPRRWMVAFAVALCLVVLLPAFPAQTTSTIAGRITDQQGAAVAGAEVRVSNASLAIVRQATSDGTGF